MENQNNNNNQYFPSPRKKILSSHRSRSKNASPQIIRKVEKNNFYPKNFQEPSQKPQVTRLRPEKNQVNNFQNNSYSYHPNQIPQQTAGQKPIANKQQILDNKIQNNTRNNIYNNLYSQKNPNLRTKNQQQYQQQFLDNFDINEEQTFQDYQLNSSRPQQQDQQQYKSNSRKNSINPKRSCTPDIQAQISQRQQQDGTKKNFYYKFIQKSQENSAHLTKSQQNSNHTQYQQTKKLQQKLDHQMQQQQTKQVLLNTLLKKDKKRVQSSHMQRRNSFKGAQNPVKNEGKTIDIGPNTTTINNNTNNICQEIFGIKPGQKITKKSNLYNKIQTNYHNQVIKKNQQTNNQNPSNLLKSNSIPKKPEINNLDFKQNPKSSFIESPNRRKKITVSSVQKDTKNNTGQNWYKKSQQASSNNSFNQDDQLEDNVLEISNNNINNNNNINKNNNNTNNNTNNNNVNNGNKEIASNNFKKSYRISRNQRPSMDNQFQFVDNQENPKNIYKNYNQNQQNQQQQVPKSCNITPKRQKEQQKDFNDSKNEFYIYRDQYMSNNVKNIFSAQNTPKKKQTSNLLNMQKKPTEKQNQSSEIQKEQISKGQKKHIQKVVNTNKLQFQKENLEPKATLIQSLITPANGTQDKKNMFVQITNCTEAAVEDMETHVDIQDRYNQEIEEINIAPEDNNNPMDNSTLYTNLSLSKDISKKIEKIQVDDLIFIYEQAQNIQYNIQYQAQDEIVEASIECLGSMKDINCIQICSLFQQNYRQNCLNSYKIVKEAFIFERVVIQASLLFAYFNHYGNSQVLDQSIKNLVGHIGSNVNLLLQIIVNLTHLFNPSGISQDKINKIQMLNVLQQQIQSNSSCQNEKKQHEIQIKKDIEQMNTNNIQLESDLNKLFQLKKLHFTEFLKKILKLSHETYDIQTALKLIQENSKEFANPSDTISQDLHKTSNNNNRSKTPIKGQQNIIQEPFLPPLDRQKHRYTLVLDLDETLIHYVDKSSKRYKAQTNAKDNQEIGYFLVRPYAEDFLIQIAKHYEIVIFTAAMKNYADWILNLVDPTGAITHRLYREHCTSDQKTHSIKDLSKIGRDLSKTIIVDNLAENFKQQQKNGIQIESWFGAESDQALLELNSLLQGIASKGVDDVREALQQYVVDIQRQQQQQYQMQTQKSQFNQKKIK